MPPCPAILVLLAAAVAPPAGEFVAISPADDRPVGLLLKLTPDVAAEFGTPAGTVTVRDLVALDRVGVSAPPLPRGPALVTTAGDRIPGRLVGGTGQALRFRPTWAVGDWTVPLSAAAVVWLTRPPADTPADPAAYPWLADRRKRDVLLLRNGDVLPGTLDGFADDPPAFRFKPEAGPVRAVPFAEVAAVAFNPALARTRKPKGPFARLVLRDGTRLAVAEAAADAEVLSGKTLFGQTVALPLDEVVGLRVAQGKAVDLSDLKPAAAEQAGFLGAGWPWAADRSVKGTPLRLRTAAGEHTFDRGLGTHPRTTLTYNLDGKYRRFEAVVGIDAGAVRPGRAAVKVLVDGKEQPLPELARLGPGPAVPVRVDVRGAKELKLVVDFGPDGDVGADMDWGDARLIEG
ncbi:MAG: NPCBM/NEW2 domain-containing protein [Gemmataceae bacterium]|nr:NPCBM/NEW2 domain-containing protein [Gemmataceae bacterium]